MVDGDENLRKLCAELDVSPPGQVKSNDRAKTQFQ